MKKETSKFVPGGKGILESDIQLSKNLNLDTRILSKFKHTPFYHVVGGSYCGFIGLNLRCENCHGRLGKEEELFVNMWRFKNR